MGEDLKDISVFRTVASTAIRTKVRIPRSHVNVEGKGKGPQNKQYIQLD